MRGKIKKAMVLAAGYGTRLLPLTERMPKPLVPVAGKPMIEYALDRLLAYGIEEVVVNVSHHKEQLMDYLSAFKSLGFKISEEAEPLETGGGLKQALSLLGNEPVFTINSDIIWFDESEIAPVDKTPSPRQCGERVGMRGYEAAKKLLTPALSSFGEEREKISNCAAMSALERLANYWDGVKMDFLLLAQSKARAVGHDKGEDHLFIKRENTIGWKEPDAPYIIAGIGVLHPRVLQNAPDGKFSVKILWHEAMRQNRLFCLPHHGRWFQTGTIADIKKAGELLTFTVAKS